MISGHYPTDRCMDAMNDSGQVNMNIEAEPNLDDCLRHNAEATIDKNF